MVDVRQGVRVRIMVAAAVLLTSACASTTRTERVQNGITCQAFGAPLVLGGAFGAVGTVATGIGGAVVSAQPATKDLGGSLVLGAVGEGLVSGVMLFVGVSLILNGRELVAEGLGVATARPSELRREVADEKRKRKGPPPFDLEPSKQSDQDEWEDKKPSRVVQPQPDPAPEYP